MHFTSPGCNYPKCFPKMFGSSVFVLSHFISMFTYLWLWNIFLISIATDVTYLKPFWTSVVMKSVGSFAEEGTRCPGTPFHPPTVTAIPDKNRWVCLFYKCVARCPRGGTKMALVTAAPTQSQTQSDWFESISQTGNQSSCLERDLLNCLKTHAHVCYVCIIGGLAAGLHERGIHHRPAR